MTDTKRKRALGMGLSALLGDTPTPEVLSQARTIPISRIQPNRLQPRTRFDARELEALTASIRQEGVLMPILVRPQAGEYELIAGERRWRAAQAAGLTDIPAVVRDVADAQALELAIIENVQRDDLSAIESARAYQRLIEEFSLTQQQVADKIGVSRVQVSNILRLLQLPESIQQMVEEKRLDMGHARALIGLAAHDARRLAQVCVDKGWSARQVEQQAKAVASGMKTKQVKKVDVDIVHLQEELTRVLGLPVELKCKASGSGELRIRFTRPKELDGVLSRLRATPA
ncbi:MAG: ParB/RepB/Spo0J family partition protein [Mariprofundaceae bacterium]